MTLLLNTLRRTLDFLYKLGGAIAGLSLLGILITIVLQMVARWSGTNFPGSTAYAGYLMASASFFAFAYALNHGAHIRVSLLLSHLGRFRRMVEIWCFGVGASLACYFTYYAWDAVYWSWKFNDISQGRDATPLWIPQSAMLIGSALFAICLVDHFVRLLAVGTHGIEAEILEDVPQE
ncbi:TRAP transporter small permease [Rhodobacteraceae bacterium RKSG542]|uniref:TRAP transporter small permease n=1 Tax=Pseudovibrio flavus TaxID=2529854 RepID=UPI0012BCF2B3|nr:TRAP transporter small permease [Pseudovibrio flavus]MTI15881.1 TRAP transporter small permease [Pseudovibrio flavus]